MRVIHVVHGKVNPDGVNGISRVVYYLNKYQKLNGVRSEVWAFVDGVSRHETYHRDEFVTVELFPRLTFFNQFNHPMIKRFEEQESSIDLVHFHMIWFLDKNFLSKRLSFLRIPYVAMTHGTYSKPVSYKGKKQIARYLYERKFLRRASAIHALSPEEIVELERYGVKNQCFVVPNGIELAEDAKNICAYDFGVDEQKILIGWVGVFRKDKNLELLIDAYHSLPVQLRENVHFILMGPDHKGYKSWLQDECKRRQCESSFSFYDAVYRDEKYSAISSCDLYIMPSFSEGMSLAILDAMALGRPCILTRGCNMTYYYKEDFFEMCEPVAQEIGCAITRICNRQDDWDAMGDAGKRLIKNVFNWGSIVEQLSLEYSRIMNCE